jgi:hypothetical protein
MTDLELVRRLIELNRAELLTRLLPHVRQRLVGKRDKIEKAEKWGESQARKEELERMLRGFRRMRPLHMANAILEDSICATAFGYRLGRSSRRAMIEDLPDGAWKYPTDHAGVPLHTLVVRRAEVYIGLTGRIIKDLGYAKNVRQAIKDVEAAIRFALWPEAPTDTEPEIEPRRHTNVVRWSVEKAILSRPPPQGPLTTDQQQLLEDALRNSHRTLVDPLAEAATVVLRNHLELPEEKLTSEAASWLCWYLIGHAQRHADTPDRALADQSTFLWAIEVVSACGMSANVAQVLEHMWPQIDGKNDEELRDFLRRRAYRPTTQELPEIGEKTRRGSCLALVSLCRLKKEMAGRSIREGQKTIDRLIDHYLQRIVRKSAHVVGLASYAGPPPAPANMYVTALHLWALESWWKLEKRPTPPKIGKTLVDQAPTLEHSIRYATEINVEDHRLFGDFLVWNGVDAKLTEVKDELTAAVDHYFDGPSPRPLNILITAPPGTGKSFFVKNVLRETSSADSLPLIEINATQLQKPSDLFMQLRRVTSQIAQHGKGLLFLDEADTQLPNGEYLFSYLLGPMWDGEYPTDGITLSMKRVVWFFAASKAPSYDEFKTAIETTAKAQDFLSRLYLKYTLPGLEANGNVLVFLGNVRRVHKNVTRMTREVLDFFATHDCGGAREIEKCVLLIDAKGDFISLEHIPKSYRDSAVDNGASHIPDWMKRESMSIVQY